MFDLAIAIGHHADAPGAALTVNGESVNEYHFWKPFARELAKTLSDEGVKVSVIERPNPKPDRDLAAQVNKTGAECAIELHFNSAKGNGSGTEMIHYPSSDEGKRLANLLQANTVNALGLRDRGLLDRTWPFLRLTTMPAVICEPFFASDAEDRFRGLTRQAALMKAYRTALCDFLV